MTKTTLYINRAGLDHDTGPGHPERIDRLKTLLELLDEKPFSDLPRKDAGPAEMDQILLAHPQSYIDHIQDSIPEDGLKQLDNDTVICPDSWQAALCAAGAACQAVDNIVTGRTDRAFCASRPPGHHAELTQSMGFCLFNNIFIAARHAQERHGIRKIAIVDFDVHHGNGTDMMARAHDGSIFFISSHQYPLWPMSGLPENNDDKVMNVTLEGGSGSDAFRSAYQNQVFPALNDFAPDLLMISAGFDAHRDDPLAGLNLIEDDFGWVTDELVKIAAAHAGGKVLSVLEGGYDLQALKNSAAAHIKALAGL